jgi:hypothetical protein
MKLKDAFLLLHENGTADHHRNFAMIFKHYNFTEDMELKEYLEFVSNETLEWIKGFPGSMVTKEQLSKPKTALVKLLKLETVKTALGAEFVANVHRKVWDTFKQNVDAIVTERTAVRMQVDTIEPFSPWDPSVPLTEDDIVTLPISVKPLRPNPTNPQLPTQLNQKEKSDAERIQLLKSVIEKMADLLPVGASDAFRLLVSHV